MSDANFKSEHVHFVYYHLIKKTKVISQASVWQVAALRACSVSKFLKYIDSSLITSCFKTLMAALKLQLETSQEFTKQHITHKWELGEVNTSMKYASSLF